MVAATNGTRLNGARLNGTSSNRNNGNNGNNGTQTKIPLPNYPGPGRWWLEFVPIKKIKFKKGNPSSRTDEKDSVSGLHEITASILRVGLLQLPICHYKTYETAEGNRRIKSLTKAGYDETWVITTDNNINAIFPEANRNQKPHASWQKIEIYLSNPCMLTKQECSRHRNAEHMIGEELLQKMVDNRLGLAVYNQAKQIVNLMGWHKEDGHFYRLALSWLIDHQQTRQFRSFYDKVNKHRGPTPEQFKALLSAVNGDKPLCDCDLRPKVSR